MNKVLKYVIAFYAIIVLFLVYAIYQDSTDSNKSPDDGDTETVRLESINGATLNGLEPLNTITLNFVVNADKEARIIDASIISGYSGVPTALIGTGYLSRGNNFVSIVLTSDSTTAFTPGEYIFKVRWNFIGGDPEDLIITTTVS